MVRFVFSDQQICALDKQYNCNSLRMIKSAMLVTAFHAIPFKQEIFVEKSLIYLPYSLYIPLIQCSLTFLNVCQISSFRVSKTDERRFYIFSPTKTLQLRTDSQKDRVAWIEALISARSKFSVDGRISYIQNDISISRYINKTRV